MNLKLALRTVTVLIVLCLAVLGIVLYRMAEDQRGARLVLAPEETRADAVIGKFTPLMPPLPAPAVAFSALSGETVTLAAFRGHVVLVNLWATWCAPCVEEMPSLARLQRKMPKLAVLAVSQDRTGAAAVEPFLARLRLSGLAIFLDTDNVLSQAFKVEGLPTSILIDRDGRVVGELVGAAQWDAPAMLRLIDGFLRLPTQAADAG